MIKWIVVVILFIGNKGKRFMFSRGGFCLFKIGFTVFLFFFFFKFEFYYTLDL